MAYELHPDGTLTDLPAQNVDTGTRPRADGAHRAAGAVACTTPTATRRSCSGSRRSRASRTATRSTRRRRTACSRTTDAGMTFLVGDGVTPSNEGRGYVLRRVIRRAAQHGLRIGMQAPFLADLADAVIEQMGDAYPEIREHADEIRQVLSAEETRFARDARARHDDLRGGRSEGRDHRRGRVHAAGDVRLPDRADAGARARARPRRERRGVHAAQWSSTARSRARRAASRSTCAFPDRRRRSSSATSAPRCRLRSSRTPTSATGSSRRSSNGRRSTRQAAARWRIPASSARRTGRRPSSSRRSGSRTTRSSSSAARASPRATASRQPCPGASASRRWRTTRRRIVLHECLREVLGDHVKQAGSAVRPDKLRFDFTHPQALTAEERTEVERRVNERVVREHARAHLRDADRRGAEARRDDALRREVRRGRARRRHRRLVARAVRRHARPLDRRDRPVRHPHRELRRRRRAPHRGGHGGRGVRAPRRSVPARRTSCAASSSACARIEAAEEGGGRPVRDHRPRRRRRVRARHADLQPGPLRDLSDRIRQQEKADGAIVAVVTDGRVHIVVNSPRASASTRRSSRTRWAEIVGGSGGGKPTMAQAGGNDPDAIPEAFAAAKKALA